MSALTYRDVVPMSATVTDPDSDDELEVVFEWHPGTPAFIPPYHRPEDYDPGSGDEFIVKGAGVMLSNGTIAPFFLCQQDEEAIAAFLDENWDRPDHNAAAVDYYYERYRDDLMDARAAGEPK